jgi:hypothetical protein
MEGAKEALALMATREGKAGLGAPIPLSRTHP